ncbi:MAG: GNAT family N-acetyltransferase [Candidatus Izimaplasma sp.]|nr:GNAT family N-acetyltransferase [Candidatus Izimaplasma bacterium]
MGYLVLESKRLIYRQFTDNDYLELHEIMSNKNVRKYLPGNGSFSEKQSLACLNSFKDSFKIEKPNLIYAVILKDTNKLIGYAGVAYVKEFNFNEILYGFNEDYWGKGYASESAFTMRELASHLKLEKIIAFTDINNQPSEKVILKLGYKYIKTIDLWGLTLKYYELILKGEQK